MKKWGRALGIDYALAISAAASAHEFRYKNASLVGPRMKDYVEEAVHAIDSSGAKSAPNYIGADLWYWGSYVHAGNYLLGLNEPSQEVLHYLAGHL